jgi:hypothetical protein
MLERHQLTPVNAQVAGDALAAHAASGVDRLGTADQHFLRVAATQRAGASERPVVDDGNLPARGTHAHARRLGSSATSDN